MRLIRIRHIGKLSNEEHLAELEKLYKIGRFRNLSRCQFSRNQRPTRVCMESVSETTYTYLKALNSNSAHRKIANRGASCRARKAVQDRPFRNLSHCQFSRNRRPTR